MSVGSGGTCKPLIQHTGPRVALPIGVEPVSGSSLLLGGRWVSRASNRPVDRENRAEEAIFPLTNRAGWGIRIMTAGPSCS